MAGWPVYSTRFILFPGAASTWASVTIPTGYVAVVKHIASANAASTAQTHGVQIGGIYVYYQTLQASTFVQATGLHLVVNAGEILRAASGVVGSSITLSGFLFQLPTATAAADLEQDYVPMTPLEEAIHLGARVEA